MSAVPPSPSSPWARLAPREQLLLRLCGLTVGAALLWTLGVAPAWQTLRTAEAAHARADAQLLRMHEMAQQAAALQAQPRVSAAQARAAFDAGVQATLGPRALVTYRGDRVSVVITGVPGDVLARWLQQLQSSASGRPLQLQIRRNARAQWDGTVTVQLSGQGA